MKRAGFRPFSRAIRVWTDGNGYFGLTNVKPGRYRVWLDREGRSGHVVAEVKAGQVTHVPIQPAAGRTR